MKRNNILKNDYVEILCLNVQHGTLIASVSLSVPADLLPPMSDEVLLIALCLSSMLAHIQAESSVTRDNPHSASIPPQQQSLLLSSFLFITQFCANSEKLGWKKWVLPKARFSH